MSRSSPAETPSPSPADVDDGGEGIGPRLLLGASARPGVRDLLTVVARSVDHSLGAG